jgi:hypothetical protein
MGIHKRLIDLMQSAWNTRDENRLAEIVQTALSPDFEFCDPHSDIRGHDAFIALVKSFWVQHGDYKVSLASNVDRHHNLARYNWVIEWPDGRRFDGFDAISIDLSSQKVLRVDGFFGQLSAV